MPLIRLLAPPHILISKTPNTPPTPTAANKLLKTLASLPERSKMMGL
jgi:hypothetical protein